MSRNITIMVPIDDERSVVIECLDGDLLMETGILSIEPFKLARTLILRASDFRFRDKLPLTLGETADAWRLLPAE